MQTESRDPQYEAAKTTMDELDKWAERVKRVAVEAAGMSVAKLRSSEPTATPIARNLEIAARLAKLGYPDIEERAKAFIKEWKGGACFIATACYGSPEHIDVRTLRAFRDEVLIRSSLGRASVRFYYRVSPAFADWLSQRPRSRAFVRKCLLQPLTEWMQGPHGPRP